MLFFTVIAQVFAKLMHDIEPETAFGQFQRLFRINMKRLWNCSVLIDAAGIFQPDVQPNSRRLFPDVKLNID